jgi:ribonuclease J
MLKIHTIGGYDEVGKNMTAVEVNDDIIVFDCGLYLPAVIDLQESERNPTSQMLRAAGAFPDNDFLLKNKNKVRAFLVTHAHLDHIGALHHFAQKFPNAQIYSTPFTIEVLKALMQDSKLHLRNKITSVVPGASIHVKGKSKTYQADFLNMTHSTIQSTMIALHTNEGVVVYANDYKLDDTPIMGKPPNYKKFKELAQKGVKVAIIDCLYADTDRKTNSEKIARAMVEESLLTVDHGNNGIIVSTFSSHIARLKSIVEFSKKIDREVIFMGRSLAKYTNAAKRINQCPFQNDIKIATYTNQLKSSLKQVEKNRGKYVIVCTGHQGEEGSILDRLVKNKLPFNFTSGDSVVFSSKVIPAQVNIQHRAAMDKKLKARDVRIFDNVHVSGHGGREDLREMLNLLKPEHFIPSHGGFDKTKPGMELAKDLGYKEGKNAHLCKNGSTIILK